MKLKYTLYILGMLLPVSVVIFMNIVLDPYNIFRYSNIASERERFATAYAIRSAKAENAFIGTSRNKSMTPAYFREIGKDSAVNILIPAGSIYEMRRYFEFAQTIHPLDDVVFELSYMYFNATVRPDYTDALITPPSGNDVKTFFAYNGAFVNSTYSALLSTHSFVLSVLGITNGKNALRADKEFRYTFAGSTPTPIPDAEDENKRGSAEENLQMILDLARQKNTRIHFYFPPLLAEYEESMYREEWSEYTAWKKRMVNQIAENNESAEPLFFLWDFADYNSVTTEDWLKRLMANASDKKSKWYTDKAHYRPILGEYVFNTMMHHCNTPCEIPTDFGVLLTPGNIESHLRETDRRRKAFLKNYPDIDAAIDKYVE